MSRIPPLESNGKFEAPPQMAIHRDRRFIHADAALVTRAKHLFGNARFEDGYHGYFSVFHRVLMVVDLTDAEEAPYGKWLAMDTATAIEAGADSPCLTAGEMLTLAREGDASMHIIGLTEQLRLKYPGTERDLIVRDNLFASYTLMAAGIHRDRVF